MFVRLICFFSIFALTVSATFLPTNFLPGSLGTKYTPTSKNKAAPITKTTVAPSKATAAASSHHDHSAPNQGCSTGPIQCCQSIQPSDQASVIHLAQSIGVELPNFAVPVGLTCSSLTLLHLGGNSCNAQTVCCENTHFDGLIAIGCNPITIVL